MVIFQKRVTGMTEATLSHFIARARKAAGLRGAVNVLITSNAEMKSLNQRFRGIDQPTDVLAFPADPASVGEFAGEIAVSAEMASQNARALGHAPAVEIKVLTLHGILHLRGYDHESDRGEMARREQRLRRVLRLPEGLIARTASGARRTERHT